MMCVTMYRGRGPDNNWAGMRGGTGSRCVSCHGAGCVHQTGRNTGVRPDIKHQPGAQSTGLKEGRLIMIKTEDKWICFSYICSLFEVFLLELFDL